MSQPYVGEIRMFGGNFAPAGWALCQGQSMAISENETLFNLIGTTYGGDGQNTFNLPDLRGRVPVHMGQGGGLSNYFIGQTGGAEQVTLTANQMTNHNHVMVANNAPAGQLSPAGGYLAQTGGVAGSQLYIPYDNNSGNLKSFNSGSLQSQGGNQPHDNMQPSLCINFIISLFGVFPSQS